MGVPEVAPILDLMRHMDHFYEKTVLPKLPNQNGVVQSPILVHCSAGIGRTGTFCISHSVIQKYKGKNERVKIQLQPILSVMREQRSGFVQQKSQYVFCYRAIEYALKIDSTQEPPTKKPRTKKSSLYFSTNKVTPITKKIQVTNHLSFIFLTTLKVN